MSIQDAADAADIACCAPGADRAAAPGADRAAPGPVQATRSGGGGALIRQPIDETAAVELARVFKALADPARLRLLSLIGAHAGGEVCVCDLTAAFDLTQPTISHHLKTLREAGLIDCQRRGTWVYYWLIPAALERVSSLLSAPVPAGA